MIEVNQDEQSSETLVKLMRQLADAKRGLNATEQALEDERIAGQNAFVMAAAAHAYCAIWLDCPMGDEGKVGEAFRAMFEAHRATTPSPNPTHVVVAVDELERLRAIETAAHDCMTTSDTRELVVAGDKLRDLVTHARGAS